MDSEKRQQKLQLDWSTDPRWHGISRPYTAKDVISLQGSRVFTNEYSTYQAKKLWDLLQSNDYINTLGALTGMQALQQVKAGLKAIYLSGWQVAADANLAEIGRAHV